MNLFRAMFQQQRPQKRFQRAVRPQRLTLERLEERQLLSTFTVTNTNDSGAGSLRQAILNSNANPPHIGTIESALTFVPVNEIDFNIESGVEFGLLRFIEPHSALPTITVPVLIDGTTQPGFAGKPLIVLEGSQAGAANGLTFAAGVIGKTALGISYNSGVRGLMINQFDGLGDAGIALMGGSNVISGNYLGTSLTGTAAAPNSTGVSITANSSGNFIGGTASAAGNVISGNAADGIDIFSGSNNTVASNLIGIAADDSTPLANGGRGVFVTSSGNFIGAPGGANTITDNGRSGVEIDGIGGSVSGNQVVGNFIGTNASGQPNQGNGSDGVLVEDASQNLIQSNTIASSKGDAGVVLFSDTVGGATGNMVQGNLIGVGAGPNSTTIPLGNAGAGVIVNNSAKNVIGSGNVISDNGQAGVVLYDSGATGNLVAGNFIGTRVTGSGFLGNQGDGVMISNAPNNTVGGNTPQMRNVISYNGGYGVDMVGSGATNNTVQGNFIGTDVSGATSEGGNHFGGVAILSQGSPVAMLDAVLDNVISGNAGGGVFIAVSNQNDVQGDFIGTDVSGTLALGNGPGSGVLIQGGADNTIGGTSAAAGNVISANAGAGITISQSGAINNLVEGNFIGTDASGTVALGNNAGVVITGGAPSNVIGGTAAGAGNVISGNLGNGVSLIGPGTSGNLVQGNSIGTDLSGTLALGNGGNGVYILQASDNTIGGTVTGAGNTIAYNGVDGVLVDTGTGNAIQQNSIYGQTNGLAIQLLNNGNNNQPAPSLTNAFSVAGITIIDGMLQNCAPDSTFTLEFFNNTMPNPSGFGEGQFYLGSLTVTTDANGNATFTATFNVNVPPGQFVSATATDAQNNTSAFAQSVQVL